MSSKWDKVRGSFDRAHEDFGFPVGEFENYQNTQYNPEAGEMVGEYNSIGSIDVEFIPPSVDASIDTEGTHLNFDTSIRAPDNDFDELSGEIIPYGPNAERPTRVTIEGETYEVQGNPPEAGSGMTMLRLTEL